MLFNSPVFLLNFLPVVLLGFAIFSITGWRRMAGLWLTLASLVFYGWWNPEYLPLLLGSMFGNYLLGGLLRKHHYRWLLILGIGLNLLLLGVYKYTGFGAQVVNQLTGSALPIPEIALPLAISFFTFQQIAYLSDAYDQAIAEHDFLNYCLFITFFPHLIAGPITHHREMLPQFSKPGAFRLNTEVFTLGVTVFLLGLAKKVILADPFGALAAPVFEAASHADQALSMLASWMGALAYTIQIYFDFSGYTDMAIGLGLLFGVRLPQNFNSPYKSHNVIEYWSRWHMSLTRFLTAYVYNPLALWVTRGREKRGLPMPRRGRMTTSMFANLVVVPTVATLFLSGIWHGAGWQFLVFGLLHGGYLVANRGWRMAKLNWGWTVDSHHAGRRVIAVAGTFICVIVAMVFFRASDVTAAGYIVQGMAGLGGLSVPESWSHLPVVGAAIGALQVPIDRAGLFHSFAVVPILVALAIVWTLPNVGQLMLPQQIAIAVKLQPSLLQDRLRWFWRPSARVGMMVGAVGFCALVRALSIAPSEFLYFKF